MVRLSPVCQCQGVSRIGSAISCLLRPASYLSAVTPLVRILLFANIGVFFLQNTTDWITTALIFIPRAIVFRPWTIFTYMFLHAGMMHLVFNMLGLFFFGPRV